MKKNIIIILLILTNCLFLLYGYQQKIQGDEHLVVAEQQSQLAHEAMEEARLAKIEADRVAELAHANAEYARQNADSLRAKFHKELK